MYRRLARSLPADYQIPQTLDGLGYFINNKHQIRSKANPDEFFNYKVSRDGRYNEMRKSVVRGNIRDEVVKRMLQLDMSLLALPQLILTKPYNGPYMPIYITKPELLKSKNRVLVVVPDYSCELGLWDNSGILSEPGLEAGSAISLVRLLEEHGNDAPGLIIMNPGELYFSHEANRGMTLQAWQNRPRASSSHPMPRIDDVWNRIPGNKFPEDHIPYVFDIIVNNKKYVRPDAKIDIITLVDGGLITLQYLDFNCLYLLASRLIDCLSFLRVQMVASRVRYITSVSLPQFQHV
jgi:hypothetical protein